MEKKVSTGMDDFFSYKPYYTPERAQPLVLAYVGDGIYEIYIRSYLLSLGNLKPHHLHRRAISYVSAKAQANILKELMPILTEQEIEVVKRGRNAKSGTVPKNTDVIVYRHSTAFETLLGFLFQKGEKDRLKELMDRSIAIAEAAEIQR